MKKAFFAFVLCLILTMAIAVAAVMNLRGDRDDVEVTLTRLTGFPEAAQGFSVHRTLQYGETLYWDMTIPLDRPEDTVTTFARNLDPEVIPQRHFDLSILSPNFSINPNAANIQTFLRDLTAFPTTEAILEPYIADVLSRAPHGQTYTEEIPLGREEGVIPLLVDSSYLRGMASIPLFQQCTEVFTAFFSFPMPEGFSTAITVTLDKDGRVTELACKTDTPYSWVTFSEASDTDLWFAFYPESSPDFSNTPGGLGLYHMDLLPGQDSPQPDLDSLSNVYSLPADAQVFRLELTEDQTALELSYRTAGSYRCDVLSTDTHQVLDSFALPFPAEREAWEWDSMTTHTGEDYRLYLFQKDFTLFTATEDGWTHAFSAPLDPRFLEAWPNSYIEAAWNGETLALAMQQDIHGHMQDLPTTGLLAACYQDGEMIYRAIYDTSLSAADEAILPSYSHPLSISWDG